MKRYRIYLLMLIALFASAGEIHAQLISFKTNALLWMNSTPNVSLELVTGRRTSLDGTVFYTIPANPLNFDLRGASVEYRYWISGRPLIRSFVGISLAGGRYDVSATKDYRHWGDAGGVGMTYGYALKVGKRWNIEFVSGVGLMFFREKRCAKDEDVNNVPYNEHGHRFLPNKVGVSAAYTF